MASASASSNQLSPLEKHLTCSICLEMFKDLVTTVCGHSFCKLCLERNQIYTDKTCPLCKRILISAAEVNIVGEMNLAARSEYTDAPGEVACDACTGKKLKARKSCLVCLASYCPTHLELHSSAQRLKGHKLVDPVEDLNARACLTHGRPLELYSRKRKACVCVRCIDGGPDEFVSTEDEWSNKKAQLGKTTAKLEQKIDERRTKVEEIDADWKSCKDAIDAEWWDIDAVFTAILAIVEEAQALMLKPLEDRRQRLKKEAEVLKDDLKDEINKLEMTISQLNAISALEDHVLFLQRYPSPENPDDTRNWEKVELDTSLSFGTMRKTMIKMMEQIQQELEKLTAVELARVSKFTEDIRLDPMTANRRLVVSDDGKEVRDGGVNQPVSDNPERFDMLGSVLGLEGFSSGRAYWEVEVGNKTGWDLGVARGSANRKGKLRASLESGYWLVTHYDGEKYAALTVPPVRLGLREKPKAVGVLVDYEEGLVSLYDLTARSHIYSFTECSFGDGLYPYFSPHAKQDGRNSEPLVISAGSHCKQDGGDSSLGKEI